MKNKHLLNRPELGILIRYTVYNDREGENVVGYGWSVWHDGHMCGGMNLVDFNNEKLPEAWYALQTDSHQLVQMTWSIH